MEKIDILLATYNGKKYIGELINSIINQTYINFRLLVCDDCSTDNTVSIIEDYIKKDNRIELYKNSKNIGSNKTFEFLLSKVENKYFMFADQDDIWNKDKIELTYNKLIEEKADLVFTDLEVVDEKLITINKSFNRLKNYNRKIKKCINNGYDLEVLYNTITGCTILSKKSWIINFLPFPNNKNILYDYWIGLIVALKGKVVYLDIPTIKYRQHSNNQVGSSRYVDKLSDFDSVREHLINLRINNFSTFIENSNLFTNYQNELNKKYLQYYLNIKDKKYMNFKGLITFNKIYKNERILLYLALFFIFNFPILVKPLYKIRSLIKRV